MEKHPEEFEGLHSWIMIQPLNGQTFVERTCEAIGIEMAAGVAAFASVNEDVTGLTYEDHNMRPLIKGVKLPTLVLQVRNDMNSRVSDIQELYDNLPIADKKLIWVEDTLWRFHRYTYFSEHPEEMIAWYNAHMD